MWRPNTPEGLERFGFTLSDVKEWRSKEYEDARPSGLDDFYRAHGICVKCGGHGKLVLGVRWRDSHGIEQAEEGPIATLIQQHGLDNPANWLNDTRKWDYWYVTCSSCGGDGRNSSPLTC